jgi:hypothetical protein
MVLIVSPKHLESDHIRRQMYLFLQDTAVIELVVIHTYVITRDFVVNP